MLMIVGYGIIAVPTGIVTVELSRSAHSQKPTPPCPACGKKGVPDAAHFCPWCGNNLSDISSK